MDVYWLYDDGGLVLVLGYLLSKSPQMKVVASRTLASLTHGFMIPLTPLHQGAQLRVLTSGVPAAFAEHKHDTVREQTDDMGLAVLLNKLRCVGVAVRHMLRCRALRRQSPCRTPRSVSAVPLSVDVRGWQLMDTTVAAYNASRLHDIVGDLTEDAACWRRAESDTAPDAAVPTAMDAPTQLVPESKAELPVVLAEIKDMVREDALLLAESVRWFLAFMVAVWVWCNEEEACA